MHIKDLPEKPYYPDYYMEMQGKDVRLCIKKIHDFFDTIFLARYSLIYCDEAEYKDEVDIKKKLFLRIHLNNAILWFDNSFDILLQSIWFMYRIWDYYNVGGSLRDDKLNNRPDVLRNTADWIVNAELNCSYTKIISFLYANKSDNNKNILKILKTFANKYRKLDRGISIRKLANQIKHGASLKISEFEEITKFNLKFDNQNIRLNDLKDKYSMVLKQYFYDTDDDRIKGDIRINYNQDYYVDIKYDNGDFFNGKDLLNMNVSYSYIDIVNELTSYNDGILSLYCNLFKKLERDIVKLPAVGEYKVNKQNDVLLEYNCHTKV